MGVTAHLGSEMQSHIKNRLNHQLKASLTMFGFPHTKGFRSKTFEALQLNDYETDILSNRQTRGFSEKHYF